MVTALSTNMLNLYPHYENHVLPFGGGILDQPNAYHKAMIIIESYVKTQLKR